MPANHNYDRLKATTVNDTPISIAIAGAEKPQTPLEFDGVNVPPAGSTGEADIRITADADESGGVDKQDLFRVETQVVLTSAGRTQLKVTVTPVKGDGTDGTPETLVVDHPENMDVWQTAAGRARQA